jgi:hypothetical protein
MQDGDLGGFGLGIGDVHAFSPEYGNGFVHQMHGAKRVVKAGVVGAWVDQVAQAQLANSAKPLKVGVLNEVKNPLRRQRNKTVDRIVKKFELVGRGDGRHGTSLITQT